MRFGKIIFLTVLFTIVFKLLCDLGLLTFYHGRPNEYRCQSLANDDKSPEHISYYDSTTLIVSKNNLIELFMKVGTEASNGYIQIIARADTEKPEIYTPKVEGFPKNIKFHPLGHYYNQATKTLAVVNQAYSYGDERIELFEVAYNSSRLVLIHKKSIELPKNEFTGRLNSLIMVNNDLIYFTTFRDKPDNINGLLYNSPLSHFLLFLKKIVRFRWTQVYRMDLAVDGSYELSVLPQGHFVMANGITMDHQERLYVADTNAKSVSIYNKEANKVIRRLQFDFIVDNLVFDPIANKVYVTGFQIPLNYLVLLNSLRVNDKIPEDFDTWTVVWEIDSSKPVEEINLASSNKLLSEKGNIRGPSVALRTGKYLYLGSWADKGPLRCERIPEED